MIFGEKFFFQRSRVVRHIIHILDIDICWFALFCNKISSKTIPINIRNVGEESWEKNDPFKSLNFFQRSRVGILFIFSISTLVNLHYSAIKRSSSNSSNTIPINSSILTNIRRCDRWRIWGKNDSFELFFFQRSKVVRHIIYILDIINLHYSATNQF